MGYCKCTKPAGLHGLSVSLCAGAMYNFLFLCRYTTDSSYKEFEQMRVSMEPLTYKHGVDIFYYGHVHAYERTAPMVRSAALPFSNT